MGDTICREETTLTMNNEEMVSSEFTKRFKEKFVKFLQQAHQTKLSFSAILTPYEKQFIRNCASYEKLKIKIIGKAKSVYVKISKNQSNQRESIDRSRNPYLYNTLKLTSTSVKLIQEMLTKYPFTNYNKEIDLLHVENMNETDVNILHNKNDTLFVPPQLKRANVFQEIRQKLPSYLYRQEILDTIEANQVVLITGKTGSGYTTQIPQYIMEDCATKNKGCRIVCTQPRRLAAISISDRVAEERGEANGQSVGYQIRLSNCVSTRTNFIYTTIGYLLRCLLNDKSYDFLKGITHLILDEVHEREKLMDFLLITIKEALATIHTDIKIILMSATLDSQIFSEYFYNCPIINVPGKYFTVQTYYLENVLSIIKFESNRMRYHMEKSKKSVRNLPSDQQVNMLNRLRLSAYQVSQRSPTEIDHALLYSTIEFIHKTKPLEGSLLVFLTGYEDIMYQKQLIETNFRNLENYQLFLLHSSLQSSNFFTDEHKRVFEHLSNGKRKIILSTNIAEASVTIDDVVYVIDAGKVKQIKYDVDTEISTLSICPISQACATQRAGRAGRTQNGECYCLYTLDEYNNMERFTLSAMLRVPLTNICLYASIFRVQNHQSIEEFLSKALQPPNKNNIQKSIKLLQKLDALDKNEMVTALGLRLADMPIDILLGKCILFGILFECINPIITIVSVLSVKDPYLKQNISDNNQRIKMIKKSFSCNSQSDHLMLLHTFQEWFYAKKTYQEKFFSYKNLLSNIIMEAINEVRLLILLHLRTVGIIKESGSQVMVQLNRNSLNWSVIKACLTAGLYPNVCHNNMDSGEMTSHLDTKLHLNTTSVLSSIELGSVGRDQIPIEWILHGERSRIGNLSIIKFNTALSAIDVALFTGPINLPIQYIFAMQETRNVREPFNTNLVHFYSVDWINFIANKYDAALIYVLRNNFFRIFVKFIKDPSNWGFSAGDKEIISILIKVLNEEEQLKVWTKPDKHFLQDYNLLNE